MLGRARAVFAGCTCKKTCRRQCGARRPAKSSTATSPGSARSMQMELGGWFRRRTESKKSSRTDSATSRSLLVSRARVLRSIRHRRASPWSHATELGDQRRALRPVLASLRDMRIYTPATVMTARRRCAEREAPEKEHARVIELNGAIDEAQAALGCARAEDAIRGASSTRCSLPVSATCGSSWPRSPRLERRDRPRRERNARATQDHGGGTRSSNRPISRSDFEVPRAFTVPGENSPVRRVGLRPYGGGVGAELASQVADDSVWAHRLLPSIACRILCWALASFSEADHLVNKRRDIGSTSSGAPRSRAK